MSTKTYRLTLGKNSKILLLHKRTHHEYQTRFTLSIGHFLFQYSKALWFCTLDQVSSCILECEISVRSAFEGVGVDEVGGGGELFI